MKITKEMITESAFGPLLYHTDGSPVCTPAEWLDENMPIDLEEIMMSDRLQHSMADSILMITLDEDTWEWYSENRVHVFETTKDLASTKASKLANELLEASSLETLMEEGRREDINEQAKRQVSYLQEAAYAALKGFRVAAVRRMALASAS
jgi:hypothetical protein